MKVGRKVSSVDVPVETRAGRAAPARRRVDEGSRGKGQPAKDATRKRRPTDGPARGTRTRATTATPGGRPRAATATPGGRPRGPRQGPQTAPVPRPVDRATPAKTTTQAKARAKARKAKAPKVIRPSLRERLIVKLEGMDLRPQVLLARIPFVMLVIAALALGLGITLWLSTASAQRSYQLGSARAVNEALAQQKEALERDVLEAQSAPALADAARNLGMIPSRDTAHLVQDPAGNWVVVGKPTPAAGAPSPPLNTRLPDPAPPAPPTKPAPPAPGSNLGASAPGSSLSASAPGPKPGAAGEVPRRITPSLPGAALSAGVPTLTSPEVPVQVPPVASAGVPHAPTGATVPGPAPLPGPAATPPAGDTLAIAPAAPLVLPVPTVAAVPDVAAGVIPVGPAQ